MFYIVKIFFRFFFKTVRAILGPILLILDKLTSPKGVERSALDQQRLNLVTRKMTLYQYKTCPFCIKTRRAIERLSLTIETRDAQREGENRQQLLEGGGKIKVPCLKIMDENGAPIWLYECNDIIRYLQDLTDQQVPAAACETWQPSQATRISHYCLTRNSYSNWPPTACHSANTPTGC